MAVSGIESLIRKIWGSLLVLPFAVMCHPAFAQAAKTGETLRGNGAAKVEGNDGGLIAGLFMVINYLAGIALVGALIFGLIALWQRLNRPEDESEEESEGAQETETAAQETEGGAEKAGAAETSSAEAAKEDSAKEDAPKEESVDKEESASSDKKEDAEDESSKEDK